MTTALRPDIDGINVRLLRTPPHNADVELALIAAVLLDSTVLDQIAGTVQAADFYSSSNARIFAAASALEARGVPVDVQTIANELRANGMLQHIGGVAYLSDVLSATPAIAHVQTYAAMVAEQARLRRLIDVCQRAAAEGYSTTGGIQSFVDSVETKVFAIARGGVSQDSTTQAFDAVRACFAGISARASDDRDTDVVPTGFTALDALLGGGLRDGELHVIAARPGMGKSALAVQIALQVASSQRRAQLGALIVSLEMPTSQVMARMMCAESLVPLQAYRTNGFSDTQFERFQVAGQAISMLPLWIDDTPAISLLQLRALARRVQRQFERRDGDVRTQRLGVIVVDYLQLMTGEGSNREQQISEISRGLKALAKELRVPIIALSQLNRAVETRSTKDKRPMLSDLRESGAIEQDADAIHFIYRPHYYIPDKTSADAQKLEGHAEIITAKQRNGPTETVRVRFLDDVAKFVNA